MWIAAVGLRCMPPASRTSMYTSLRALFSTSLHGLDDLVHRTAEWACSQSRKVEHALVNCQEQQH
eukprot:12563093-Alexandrium_andersonii.AAC.1